MEVDTPVEFDPPKEHNVVCHFNVGRRFSTRSICGNILHNELRERASSQGFRTIERHNFVVFCRGKLSFTFFPFTGHVSCSGTPERRFLWLTAHIARRLFGECRGEEPSPDQPLEARIVSSPWSGLFPHLRINVPKTADALQRVGFSVCLRAASFPGAVIRRAGLPTLILFASAKYVVVGAINAEDVWRTVGAVAENLACLCCVSHSQGDDDDGDRGDDISAL
jgi:hypothetical protein